MHRNKNNHTTSTKCQYQALASKPKCRTEVKWERNERNQDTTIKIVPRITCKPWKPVARKNAEPYTESAIVNAQYLYSNACNSVKMNPNNVVRAKPYCAVDQRDLITDLWAHVIVHPLANKTVVLSSGTSNGWIVSIPTGGHTLIPIPGLREEWKKAQKKAKKKQTSLTIKSTIPIRIPFSTFWVCFPCSVASRTTSRHHCQLDRRIIRKPAW